MQFIKPDVNIDFVGKRKIAFTISLLMIVISIASLIIHKGPRYGIDFAGGTLVQVKFAAAVPIDRIKSGLADMGMNASAVQQFGQAAEHEYLIRTDSTDPAVEGLANKIEVALKAATGVAAETRRGPAAGASFSWRAFLRMSARSIMKPTPG